MALVPNPKTLILIAFAQLLFFATCPLQGIFMLFFIIWRILIWIYLKLKHGEKFGGLLTLVDSFFEIKLRTKMHTHFCLIVKSSDNFDDFFARIKTTLRDKSSHSFFKKLSSYKLKCCGIDYLLKDEFKVDEIVNIWDLKEDTAKFIEKQQIEQIISSYALKDLPENNSRFLEIQVLNKKVKISNTDYYNHDNDHNYYAILIKLHHSLSDGLHFTKFLGYLSDQNDFEVFTKSHKKIILLRLLMRIVFYTIGFIAKIVRINTDQSNYFINKTLTHRDYFKFHVEDEVKFIPLIKNIRKQIPNTTFSDIVIAAITASLSDFYQKRNIQESSGDNFYVLIPVAFQTTKDSVLANKFSWTRKLLPLNPTSKQSVYQKLEKIRLQNIADKNSGEPEFMSLCQQLLTLLPPFLSSYFMNEISLGSTLISIVPAFGKNVKLFGGQLINFIGYAPPMPKIGIIFTLLTYNDRFQLAFSIDEAFVKSSEEGDEIIAGMYKYLLKLADEIHAQKVTV